MRQRLFEINEQDAFEEAKQRFIKTCGFDLQKNKHQKMMKMGEKVREDGIDGIEIRAMLSFCDKSILTDEGLKVAGETLAFPYLERIPRDAVCGVYFYGLTVGECYFSSEENIMDFLYADIYDDLLTDLLIRHLEERALKARVAALGDVLLNVLGVARTAVFEHDALLLFVEGDVLLTRIGHAVEVVGQAVDHLAAEDGSLDDLVAVLGLDVDVHDAHRLDMHERAHLAEAVAAAHFDVQALFLNF